MRPKALLLFGGLTVGVLLLAAAILAQIPGALLARQADGGDSRARDVARLGVERLHGARNEAQLAEVERLARSALDTSPLESRGVSLLAQVRFRQGRAAEGGGLMQAAGRVSRRDDDADRWAYFQALTRGQYELALTHLDAVLRRQPAWRKPMVKTLFPYLGDPAMQKPLLARLALGPGWRPQFFERITDEYPDTGLTFRLLDALKATRKPPTPVETSSLLTRLVRTHQYEQAYLAWSLLMPPADLARQGNLQDGGFDGWTAIPPFGWNFKSNGGGGGEIADLGAGKGSALHVIYDGRRDQWLVRQLLVLPPGDYRLSGRFRTDASGRTEWRILCEGPPGLIAQAPIGASGDWRTFSLDLTIPAEGCSGQSLVLEGLPPAQAPDAPIEAWFDDISIVNRHAS